MKLRLIVTNRTYMWYFDITVFKVSSLLKMSLILKHLAMKQNRLKLGRVVLAVRIRGRFWGHPVNIHGIKKHHYLLLLSSIHRGP